MAQNDSDFTNALTPPKIDYLIFLDSDDFWERECLKACVECALKSKSPDIVWFSWSVFYDGIKPPKHNNPSWLEKFGYDNAPCEITAKQWLERAIERKISYSACMWDKMLHFDYLRRINFCDYAGIVYEDVLSSLKVFSQARRIVILPQRLTRYRVRDNSTTNFVRKQKRKEQFPPFTRPLLDAFSSPNVAWWGYFHHYCLAGIALETNSFCDSLSDRDFGNALKAQFLPHTLREALNVLGMSKDPYHIQPQLLSLLASLDSSLMHKRSPILLRSARFRHLLLKKPSYFRLYRHYARFHYIMHTFYEWQKGFERKIRQTLRSKLAQKAR